MKGFLEENIKQPGFRMPQKMIGETYVPEVIFVWMTIDYIYINSLNKCDWTDEELNQHPP